MFVLQPTVDQRSPELASLSPWWWRQWQIGIENSHFVVGQAYLSDMRDTMLQHFSQGLVEGVDRTEPSEAV